MLERGRTNSLLEGKDLDLEIDTFQLEEGSSSDDQAPIALALAPRRGEGVANPSHSLQPSSNPATKPEPVELSEDDSDESDWFTKDIKSSITTYDIRAMRKVMKIGCSTMVPQSHQRAHSHRPPGSSLAFNREFLKISMYKNQLQELAQRSCFNLPSYSSVREGPDHAPRFKATVNFNGETFESPTFCPTLRLAEHAAAEVALNTLATRGPSKTLAVRVLDETGIYKNLLQETAHRAGLKLPLYTTIRSGPGHVPVFSCTVELAGMSFSGEPGRTKKQAQKNAAMAAWAALRQLAQSRTSPSASSTPVPQVDGTDEQDQVIIARILASLQLSEPNKSPQIDQQRFITTNISQDPPLPLPPPSYSRRHESWARPSFPTELAIYQLWQQQAHLLQLQPRLYPFQISLNPPNPLVVPRVQTIFQENVPMRPVAAISTLSPPPFIPRGLVPSPSCGSSMVKIQEIEEKTEPLSNLSKGETPVVIGEQSQVRQRQPSLDSIRVNRVRLQRPLVLNSHGFDRSLNQNMQNQAPAQLQMRTGASANMAGTMSFGRATSCFMAPAVQIRSVAPVRSAPPVTVRKVQNTSQVGQSSDQEAKKIGRDDGDVSELSSGVAKLRI